MLTINIVLVVISFCYCDNADNESGMKSLKLGIGTKNKVYTTTVKSTINYQLPGIKLEEVKKENLLVNKYTNGITTYSTTQYTPTPTEFNKTSPNPQSNRPSFDGMTSGDFHPQTDKLENYKRSTSILQNDSLMDNFKGNQNNTEYTSRPLKDNDTSTQHTTTQSSETPIRPPPNRPPFAGDTGGDYYQQLIPPGEPWPSKPEDYERFTSIPPSISLEDRLKDNVTSTQHTTTQSSETSTRPQPNRPPFVGETEGNFNPQLIPPGKPWPSKPEDYEDFTSIPPSISFEDRLKENVTSTQHTTTQSSETPTRTQPNRPPFAGETGGNYNPQLISPGKPWPSKPEDYEDFTSIPQSISFEDRLKDNVTSTQNTTTQSSETPTRPQPNRPPFAGETGGNYYPQLIPPGKPLPSKPEDYEGFTSIPPSISFEDRLKENVTSTQHTTTQSSEIPTRPQPNRPPFAGETGGNFYPQLIPPGKPWPSKPEDYEGFTSIPPSISFEDRLKENVTSTQHTTTQSSEIPTRPQPNRPPFAGETGGNYYPQLIPPGKPWPSKPEDYEGFTSIPPRMSFEDRLKENVTSTQHTTTQSSEIPTRLQPNRPPFAGETGGNYYPQLIPPGKPWPSKPEDYEGFTSIPPSISFEDRLKENVTSTQHTTTQSSETSTRPQPNRPPFAGETEGNYNPQLISPGKPWPSKPEDYEGFTSIPPSISFEDRLKENVTSTQNTTTQSSETPTRPQPNRPPFAGQTGGNYYPQLIPPGKPWPSKPEDYAGFTSIPPSISLEDRLKDNVTSTQHTTTQSSEIPTRPQPNRPPFAGQTGGNYYPQLIPPGKPWPSKPEDYEGFTSIPPSISFEDRLKENVTSTQHTTTQSSETSTRPQPNRPPFAGETEGNYNPQLISPGKPWPSKPEDYEDFTSIPQSISFEDRLKDNVTSTQHTTTQSSEIPTRPQPNRPPFAGQTGGNYYPQLIPPGKPWPSKPEDYEGFTSTPPSISLEDRLKDNVTSTQNTTTQSSETPTRPQPNRPPFAGETGGNFYPQLIRPGKPWPSKPDDNGFNSILQNIPLEDKTKETTTSIPYISSQSTITFNGPPSTKPPYPHITKPIKPSPPKPDQSVEDRFKETTTSIPHIPSQSTIASTGPSSTRPPYPQITKVVKPSLPTTDQSVVWVWPTENPLLEDRFKETTILSSTRPSKRPTGGNLYTELIRPGKPEDHEGFTSITQSISQEDKLKENITSTQHISTQSNKTSTLPQPNRPPFAGQTGGNFYPQLVPPGKPWPSKPEDYGFTSTLQNIPFEDRFKETTTSIPYISSQSTITSTGPSSTAPPYPQITKPVKPSPPKPNQSVVWMWPTENPLLEDRFKETTISSSTRPSKRPTGQHTSTILVTKPWRPKPMTKPTSTQFTPTRPPPNRPAYAGLTGGNYNYTLVRPGKPWPSRPEYYEGFSVTSKRPKTLLI